MREKLVDPQFEDWFLKFGAPPFANGTYHVPRCDANYEPPLCTDFYHSQDQTPGFPSGDGDCPGPCDCGGVPCGFYVFNHANATLRRWLIDDFVMGATGVGDPSVHGVYLDDQFTNFSNPVDAPDCGASPVGGPTEVNAGCAADIGFSQAQTTAIADGWRGTMLELQGRLLDAGAFSWAYFNEMATPARGECAAFFRANASDVYASALMHKLSKELTPEALQRDLAAFLALRGPYAWLGSGWQGCSAAGPAPLPAELFLDYGVPLNNVSETAAGSGVFERRWSRALVRVNCSDYTGAILWS